MLFIPTGLTSNIRASIVQEKLRNANLRVLVVERPRDYVKRRKKNRHKETKQGNNGRLKGKKTNDFDRFFELIARLLTKQEMLRETNLVPQLDRICHGKRRFSSSSLLRRSFRGITYTRVSSNQPTFDGNLFRFALFPCFLCWSSPSPSRQLDGFFEIISYFWFMTRKSTQNEIYSQLKLLRRSTSFLQSNTWFLLIYV